MEIIDLNGVIVYLNEAYVERFKEAADAAGKCVFDLCEDPGHRKKVEAFFSSINEGSAKPGIIHSLYRTKDVSFLDCEVKWHYLKKDGQILGIVIILSDITEEMKVHKEILSRNEKNLHTHQNALLNMKNKLDMALEAAKEGIWEWDLRDDSVNYDDRYFQILGYEREDLENVDNIWHYLIHPEDIERYNKAYKAFLEKKGRSLQIEYRLKKKDGSYKWILDKGKAVEFDESGSPVKLLGVHLDIDRIMKKSEELNETQKTLAYVLKNARVGIWKWYMQENRAEYDHMAQKILGCDPSNPPGRYRWRNLVAQDDINRLYEDMQEYLKGNIPEYDVTYRFKKPGSRMIWIHETGDVLEYDADGNPRVLAGSLRDVTQQKEFEELLVRAKDEAQEASRMKSELISNINHELRTPLTIIMGMAETLLNIETDKDKTGFLNEISESSKRLLQLIDEILELSKIENSSTTVQRHEFNVRKLITDFSIGMKQQTERKGLEYILDIDDSVPTIIKTDQNKLVQVLNNLLSNAIKFTDEGSIRLEVKSSDNGGICFYVKDTGIGIPQEEKDNIFKRFYQVDASNKRKYGGTGLGLSIVEEIVNLLKGELTVESEPGKGSVFRICLPV